MAALLEAARKGAILKIQLRYLLRKLLIVWWSIVAFVSAIGIVVIPLVIYKHVRLQLEVIEEGEIRNHDSEHFVRMSEPHPNGEAGESAEGGEKQESVL